MARKTSSEKYREKIEQMVARLSRMSKEEAEAYLDGQDLIFAQHCFNKVFEHYMEG